MVPKTKEKHRRNDLNAKALRPRPLTRHSLISHKYFFMIFHPVPRTFQKFGAAMRHLFVFHLILKAFGTYFKVPLTQSDENSRILTVSHDSNHSTTTLLFDINLFGLDNINIEDHSSTSAKKYCFPLMMRKRVVKVHDTMTTSHGLDK